MSASAAIAGIALLSSVAHGAGTYDVTAGPAKTGALPGASVIQKVSNHGTLAETVKVGIDEIGHSGANGTCGFNHSAPLAVPSVTSLHLNPGESRYVTVKVNPTGPAGYHAVAVAYTTGGTGAVKVTQGVATVIGVTYPGSSADSAPCVAVAETPKPSSGLKLAPVAATAGLAGLTGLGIFSVVRRRRNRRAARRTS